MFSTGRPAASLRSQPPASLPRVPILPPVGPVTRKPRATRCGRIRGRGTRSPPRNPPRG